MSAETAVSGQFRAPDPPSDLVSRGRGRKFWRAVTGEFVVSAQELELIAEVCRTLDLLDRLRDEFADEQVVVDGRTHPLLVEQRLVRQELRLALSTLGLSDDGEPLSSRHARRAAEARWQR